MVVNPNDPRFLGDEQFIDAPKQQNDIDRFQDEFPDGVPAVVVADLLHMPLVTVERLYKKAIHTLQKMLR